MITAIEARQIGDYWCVRYSDADEGRYKPYKKPIDAFFDYVADCMGIEEPRKVRDALKLTSAAVTRVRIGKQKFDHAWILWAHELSGAPIESLRIVTGTKRP